MRAEAKEAVENSIRELLAQGDLKAAATHVIRSYGPQILAYLRAVLRDEDAAAEAFSRFCEGLWSGLGKFRGESAVLTWAFGVAWGAVRRLKRDPFTRKRRRLGSSELSRLGERMRSTTLPFRRTKVKDAVARLRESLEPDEQPLLILRVDRELPWKDVAQVFNAEGDPVDERALRKRFERIKAKLRKMAEAEGLLGGA